LQYQKPLIIQEQRLKMNPQLYQSIQLMALPIQDLKIKIQEEIEKNPALEVIEDKSEISLEDLKKNQTEEYDYFENSSDPGYSAPFNEEASDNKRKFLEGAIARPESLQDHLLWQLKLQPIPKNWFKIGELLIQNLNGNGFHQTPPETLISKENLPLLSEVMGLIRKFEPLGVCTRDYRESLIVQTELSSNPPQKMIELLSNHFALLEKNKHSVIKKKMRIKQEELDEMLIFLKTLSPFPGRAY